MTRPGEQPYPAHAETDFGNPPWAEAGLRILIARLSPFRDVERSAPHQFLFRELRDLPQGPGLYLDFCFLPEARERAGRERDGIPWMLGLASARGAAEFDAILVSNAYTLELVNLIPMLEKSGIPRSRLGRSLGTYPLIALGGSNAMAAGSLVGDTDAVVDCLFFGEGEGRAGRIGYALAAAGRARGSERAGMLSALADSADGLWVVANPRPVRQARAAELGFPASAPPALSGEEASTARLEITLGCPGFCSFCFEGWERKPYRERGVTELLAEARRLKAAGIQAVELASYNFNAHSGIARLLVELNRLFDRVNAMSQRADLLATTPGLLELEILSGKRNFTLGVEGLSQRMRGYYGKDLSEATALRAARMVIESGARELALFYILSGFETPADLAEFRGFCAKLAALLDGRPRVPRVILSVGALVRMPFTPLAWEELKLEADDYAPACDAMAQAAAEHGWDYRGPEDWDAYRLSQVLALAPPASRGLLDALADSGAVFDLRLSPGAWDRARAYLEERSALSPAFLSRKKPDYPFAMPWLKGTVDPGFAWKRFEAAIQAREQGSCFASACLGCDACRDEDERSFLAGHRIAPAGRSDLDALAAIMEAKRRPALLYARGRIEPREARAHPQLVSRRIMAEYYGLLSRLAPDEADALVRAEDAFLLDGRIAPLLPMAHGDSWFRLAFTRAPSPATVLALNLSERPPEPARLTLRIDCPDAPPARLGAALASFLEGARLPATMRRRDEVLEYALSDKAIKRRNVLSARAFPVAGGSAAELVFGPKFDLGGFPAAAKAKGLSWTMTISLPE